MSQDVLMYIQCNYERVVCGAALMSNRDLDWSYSACLLLALSKVCSHEMWLHSLLIHHHSVGAQD